MNRNFLFIFYIYISCSCSAQQNDAGLWASFHIEKKISKKFTVDFSPEVRLDENLAEAGTVFTEAGIEYKILKRLTAAVILRYTEKRKPDESYSARQRAMFDLAYRYKIQKFNITLRERIQSQVTDDPSDKLKYVNYLRNKISVKYDTAKKYQPWISAEIFYQLNNYRGNEIDNLRYAAGFDYKLNKKNTFGLFYLINKEVNVNDPLTDFVTGISYTLTL
jgi:hypothetical protein